MTTNQINPPDSTATIKHPTTISPSLLTRTQQNTDNVGYQDKSPWGHFQWLLWFHSSPKKENQYQEAKTM